MVKTLKLTEGDVEVSLVVVPGDRTLLEVCVDGFESVYLCEHEASFVIKALQELLNPTSNPPVDQL